MLHWSLAQCAPLQFRSLEYGGYISAHPTLKVVELIMVLEFLTKKHAITAQKFMVV